MGDDNRTIAATYILPEQHEQWEAEADEMGLNKSQYIEAMCEAGRKKFDRTVEPDKSREEIRRERDEYFEAWKEERERNAELRERMLAGEREMIMEFVEDNSGCSFDAIVQKLADSAHERASKALAELEGSELTRRDDDTWVTK